MCVYVESHCDHFPPDVAILVGPELNFSELT
jgi:hypothetical protein